MSSAINYKWERFWFEFFIVETIWWYRKILFEIIAIMFSLRRFFFFQNGTAWNLNRKLFKTVNRTIILTRLRDNHEIALERFQLNNYYLFFFSFFSTKLHSFRHFWSNLNSHVFDACFSTKTRHRHLSKATYHEKKLYTNLRYAARIISKF